MQNLERVPCVQVTKSNWRQAWPMIESSINRAFFVAIDFEFSGIGDRTHNQQKDLNQRYKILCETAKTRSVISIGLSIFELLDTPNLCNLVSKGGFRKPNHLNIGDLEEGEIVEEDTNWYYLAQNFNIFCECTGDYVREEQAFEFLTSHGFNLELFNNDSIPYERGNDVPGQDSTVRQIFSQLIRQHVPITLHNGFMDLFFLYHHFYCELPEDVQTFLADLDHMFPSGVFDTKYICEKETDLPISYLTRLFYEIQRININKITLGEKYLLVDFLYDLQPHDHTYTNLKTHILNVYPKDLKICSSYEFKGWCPNHNNCNQSHNIDFILDNHSIKSPRELAQLKRMRDVNQDREVDARPQPDDTQEQSDQRNLHAKQGTHSAGYDAFMTGYCFASFLVELCTQSRPSGMKFDPKLLGLMKIKSQIHLHGNAHRRVTIMKSQFIKNSSNHLNKISQLC